MRSPTITVVGTCEQCRIPIVAGERYFRQVVAWESPNKALSKLTPTGVVACMGCRGDTQANLFDQPQGEQ